MRISCDPDDAGYANFNKRCKFIVTVNGAEVFDVVTADEERGVVVKHCSPISFNEFGLIDIERLYGVVKITEKEA